MKCVTNGESEIFLVAIHFVSPWCDLASSQSICKLKSENSIQQCSTCDRCSFSRSQPISNWLRILLGRSGNFPYTFSNYHLLRDRLRAWSEAHMSEHCFVRIRGTIDIATLCWEIIFVWEIKTWEEYVENGKYDVVFRKCKTLREVGWYVYVTRYHKRWIQSLGSIRATGKEVKDNHCVLHLTPTLQLTVTSLSFEIRAWFQYQIKRHFVYLLTVPISQEW